MNRRDSLKGLGSISLAGLAGVAPSVMAATAKPGAVPPMLRGTQDGLILESLNAGATWNVVSKFGSGCAVRRLQRVGDWTYVQVVYQDHPFVLASRDARKWVTCT